MPGRYRLQKLAKKLHKDKPDEPKDVPGVLGLKLGGKKRTQVPQRVGFVYVRLRDDLSEVVQAFNDKVSLVYDLPVIIRRDKINKSRWIVIGTDTGRYGNWGAAAYLPNHNATHSFDPQSPGNDIVWVWGTQVMPLAAIPSGTLGGPNVIIEPGTYRRDEDWFYVGGTGTANLLTYKPTGSSARLVLVYIDANGNPQVTPGSSFFDASITGSSQIYQYIPGLVSSGDTPIAAIRLLSGTASILWGNIYDLRSFGYGGGLVSGTGGGATINGHVVQDDGTPLTQRANINFVGTGLTAYDDAVNNATIVSGTSVAGTSGHVIQDDGTPLTQRAALNFVGAGLVAYDSGGVTLVSGIASVAGGGHTIQDDGTPFTNRSNLNFVGTGFVVYDDASGDTTVVSGTASGGPGDLTNAIIKAPDSSVRNTIQPTGDYVGLVIKENGNQTTNLHEYQTASGTVTAGTDNNGRLFSRGHSGETTNCFIGGAGNSTLSGDDLVGIGNAALFSATITTQSVALGSGALQTLTSGEFNVGIGYHSFDLVTTGQANTGVGWSAGHSLVTGSTSNTAIGFNALGGEEAYGSHNVAIGAGALSHATVSTPLYHFEQTVAIGAGSGDSAKSSLYNVMVGYNSGSNMTSGSSNVYLGNAAGRDNTYGSRNIYIGYLAGYTGFTGDDQLIIDNAGSADPFIFADLAGRTFELDQTTQDGVIFELKSTGDVAHGMTNIADTETYGYINKFGATTGGINEVGLSSDTVGMQLSGIVKVSDATKGTGSFGALTLRGLLATGTALTNSDANENIVAIRTRVGGALRTIAIFDAEGDLHLDAVSNNNVWDDYDDVILLSGLRASVMSDRTRLDSRWKEWVEYARPVLEKTGVVTFNTDGHHFISTKRLHMLQIDAVRQLYDQVNDLKQALQRSEDRFNRLIDKLDRLGLSDGLS